MSGCLVTGCCVVGVAEFIPGLFYQCFRCRLVHVFRHEERFVHLVNIVVGLGEVRAEGVEGLPCVVRKQRWDLGRDI